MRNLGRPRNTVDPLLEFEKPLPSQRIKLGHQAFQTSLAWYIYEKRAMIVFRFDFRSYMTLRLSRATLPPKYSLILAGRFPDIGLDSDSCPRNHWLPFRSPWNTRSRLDLSPQTGKCLRLSHRTFEYFQVVWCMCSHIFSIILWNSINCFPTSSW